VAALAPYASLLEEEVNVKDVRMDESIESWASFRLQPNFRLLGPRLGPRMKALQEAVKIGRFERLDGERVRVGDEVLEPGEWELRLVPREGVACEPLSKRDAIVVLDTRVTPELEQEGVARDVVRGVQQARKEADFHVSDRIRLALALPPEWRAAVERHRDWIAEQTLARRIDLVEERGDASLSWHDAELGGRKISIGLARLE
jgi:isoleucyl-tRNA synthetase